MCRLFLNWVTFEKCQMNHRNKDSCNLSFGVRSGPRELPAPPQLGDLLVQSMGQDHGEGHTLLCLVCGVAKHQTLSIDFSM